MNLNLNLWMLSRYLFLVLIAGSLLSGCAVVSVSSITPSEYLAQRRGDILTTNRLSAAAQEILRVVGMDGCRQEPLACRQALLVATGITDEQRLSALSELWLEHALAQPQLQSPASTAPNTSLADVVDPQLDAWLETARHAYAYLFHTARNPGERAFEDRQTQVRDYYNYAVQQAIAHLFGASKRTQHSLLARTGTGRLAGWHITSNAVDMQLQQGAGSPKQLIAASSLRFTGLRNSYRRDGFGAEFVAVMPKEMDEHMVFQQSRYPSVTALLAFEGHTLQEVLQTRNIQVLLYDPYRNTQATLAGEYVPLAANYTAGYGLWLANSGFATQSLRSLFGLRDGIVRPRVQLMQPWDPQRRIVVMLHGLASSPEAWVNVANEVMGDEVLRRNYQIWQVYYPTNAPLALNRYAIWQALQKTLAHFDPEGQYPASHGITLVGHSMGGVLARLLVSSTGEHLLTTLLSEVNTVQVLKTLRSEGLDDFLRFEPMPQVTRAIFIAAPHRGTSLANHRIARHMANLVTLPLTMLNELGELGRLLTQAPPRASGSSSNLRIPTSIDNLSDRDPFVQAAAQLPISGEVRYHTIVGQSDMMLPLAQSSDSIVPYTSAHLEGALSERVIASGHSVQETPAAIVEIRRVLHEHLNDSGR